MIAEELERGGLGRDPYQDDTVVFRILDSERTRVAFAHTKLEGRNESQSGPSDSILRPSECGHNIAIKNASRLPTSRASADLDVGHLAPRC